jgi:hypothetical protein
MTHEWTNEEQSEGTTNLVRSLPSAICLLLRLLVMKFYGINVLDLEEWPEPSNNANTNNRLNSLSLSSILGGSASEDAVNPRSGDVTAESTYRPAICLRLHLS